MKLSTFLVLLLSKVSMYGALCDVPHITLSASATIRKPADELQIKICIVTLGSIAEDTLEENSFKMNNIIESLETAGLDRDDYETSQFSINPTYTPYPVNPPVNWKPTINGYEVTNSILIHTTKLDIVGKLIDLASKEGATSVTDVRFGIRNPREYWAEAVAAAGANAIQDAQAIAKATGVKLIRVLSISLNQMRVHAPQLQLSCFAKAGAMNSAPPIEAGDLSIDASVTLVYEIN